MHRVTNEKIVLGPLCLFIPVLRELKQDITLLTITSPSLYHHFTITSFVCLFIYKTYPKLVNSSIPPIWFGLAFLRIRLPCSDPTTDDFKSRVELVVGTYSIKSCMNAVSF